jgi:PAS domain S-box-containing protein
VPASRIDLAALDVAAEDFLAAVLDTVAQPIWVVDPGDLIRFANPAAVAALGYERADELLGRRSHDTIHYAHPDGSPYPSAECPMLLPRSTGETVSCELDWFFRRDGTMFPVSYVSAPIEMPDGRGAVVAFTDIEERRRVVRDLHDGAQQRLVHTVITLKLAEQALPDDGHPAPALVREALGHVQDAVAELRELAHGILPSVLARGGLCAGVDALALRMPIPVETDVSVDRLPAAVEATAYFVTAEALTNVAKHARASSATVRAHVDAGTLRLEVQDDGIGGARSEGSGLLGLKDRLAVLHGRLVVEDRAASGTLVAAEIPLADALPAAGRP